jgi:ABC-type nickel/cobalt efflux system permease component RcnA
MSNGLVIVVMVFVIIGLFVKAGYENNRNPQSRKSVVGLIVVVFFIFIVCLILEGLLSR